MRRLPFGLIAALLAGCTFSVPANDVYVFDGIKGPAGESRLVQESPTPWQRYDRGGPSRLAILLTDPNSSWLGLAHGFKSLGIPFTITTDYRRAVTHRMVIVYPIVSGRALSPAAFGALAQLAHDGGTIVGFNVVSGDALFGFRRSVVGHTHRAIQFDRSQPAAREFSEPEERTIPFGVGDPSKDIASYTFAGLLDRPAATYEDGSPAIARRALGKGATYAFGIDIGFLFLKGYNNRQERISPAYVNSYEPTIDVFLRYVRNLYAEAEPDAVFLSPVPDGKLTSVLISHDVDAAVSIANCPAYAAAEKQMGIRTSYFIQTKYIRDDEDVAFFDKKGAAIVSELQRDGMEVGSHTVSHSRQFAHFPLGTGREAYPDYLPYVKDEQNTYGGTVFGELRVSKFLLEQFTNGAKVVSFRPGYLSNPYSLPGALESTGYMYSTSATANDSLTHLPFRLNVDRLDTTESSIYEFPVTVEDQEPPRMDLRERDAESLAEKIGRYGGIFEILIHPNVLSYKMRFERTFVAHFKKRAWFGTVEQFGDWWRTRDGAEVDVAPGSQGARVTLTVPRSIRGLALMIPSGSRVSASEPAGIVARQEPGRVILGAIDGTVTLDLTNAEYSGP